MHLPTGEEQERCDLVKWIFEDCDHFFGLFDVEAMEVSSDAHLEALLVLWMGYDCCVEVQSAPAWATLAHFH